MGDSHRLESGILIFVWLLGAWVLCRHRTCWVGRWGPGTACSGSAPVRGGVHRSCGKALMKQGWQSGREWCSSNCFSLGSDTIHLEHTPFVVVTLAKSFVVVAWLHLRARALAFLLPCTGQMGIFADSQ